MKILGLDSSGNVASVAVVEDQVLLAEYTVNYKKTHSQTLLPMLDEIVRMTELDLETLDAIAVSAGPGSFTGLRIGAAAAKGLGLALNKPLAAVPTTAGMACGLYGLPGLICPIMDARRNQVYTGIYRFCGGRLITVEDQMAVGIEDLISILNGLLEGKAPLEGGTPGSVTFLGDGVPVFEKEIRAGLRCEPAFAPAHLNRQRAGTVAWLGMQLCREGKTMTAEEFRPEYLRVSQAERERAARQKKVSGEVNSL